MVWDHGWPDLSIMDSSSQLCTFSSSKDLMTQQEIFPPQNWKAALVATVMSGTAVAMTMIPFDVVGTRL